MAKKIIKRVAKKSGMTKTEAENSQLELFQVKQSQKALTKREEELKARLGEYMQKSIKPDGKGHYLFTTKDEKGEKIHLQRQARRSISLNQERAQATLKELELEELIESHSVVAAEVTQDQIIEVLLKHAPHLVDEQLLVNESLLEQAVLNEEITMEQFEGMCDIKLTYAMTYIDDKKLQQE